VTSKVDFLWYQEFIGMYVWEFSTFVPIWSGETSREISDKTKVFRDKIVQIIGRFRDTRF